MPLDLEDNYLDMFNPVKMLVVYQQANTKDNQSQKHNGGALYMESHDLYVEKGKTIVGAGSPLDVETIRTLVADYAKGITSSLMKTDGLLSEQVLYINQNPMKNAIVWYNPTRLRKMHFKLDLGIPSGYAPVPCMIYYATDKECHVFCYKGDGRPTLETELYMAPFHNVYDDGSVCWGNVKVKKNQTRTFNYEMQRWEDAFWNSEFAHLNNDKVCALPVNAVWTELIANQYRAENRMSSIGFPEQVLLKSEEYKNLNALIYGHPPRS